jgi:hypothetical protein
MGIEKEREKYGMILRVLVWAWMEGGAIHSDKEM